MKRKELTEISIYYAFEDWGRLTNTVSTFIRCAGILESSVQHFVLFDHDRGDNIRILWYDTEGTNRKAFRSLHKSILDFLSVQKSVSKPDRFLPGSTLWCAYPNNSVQIRYFDFEEIFEDKRWMGFCRKTSDLLLDLFAVEMEIDEETILSVNLFVTVRLVKSLISVAPGPDLAAIITSIEKQSEIVNRGKLLDLLNYNSEQDLKQNVSIIEEYFYSPLDDEEDIQLINWLSEAITLYRNSPRSKELNFQSLLHIVNRHFGLRPSEQLYILKMINAFFAI